MYNFYMKKIILPLFVICAIIISTGFAYASQRYIVVNKAYHLLFVEENEKIVKIVPVTIGKGGESETPVGTFTIRSIVHNPNWYFNGKAYKPYIEDYENGLGVCWMGLSLPSYGLHGTNEPFSPGRDRSHGCVRMNNKDISMLSQISFIGEEVRIEEGAQDSIAKHLKSINLLYDIENLLGGD
jgi:lipoprotein-anchoring transpeptidase ErfK/SrfK